MGEYGHGSTHLHDLPDVILTNIFSLVGGGDTRSRNSMSLVSRRWRQMERSTRTAITLRGSSADLYRLPTCFPAVTHLDISLLSPWGCSLRHPSDPTRHVMSAALLQARFPRVTHLTAYARYREDLAALAPQWPALRHVKLVRWHPRPQGPAGSDLEQVFRNCPELESLDLSSFYCWTEDIPAALQAYPSSAAKLIQLNLLSLAGVEGFKTPDIGIIAELCPNLQQLMVPCAFDPRYDDSVCDDALVALASRCRRLKTLHLVEYSAVSNPRGGGGDGDGDGLADGVLIQEEQAALQDDDARITQQGLEALATGLSELEDLALDVCNNVRGAGPALEWLGRRCPRLRSLRVGRLQGVCRALALHLDGVSVCGPLSSLCIKECLDLTDAGLAAIARGCSRLSKVALVGCPGVSAAGVEKMARALRRTLVDVEVSRCAQLDTRCVLRALEPIRRRIERLHVDCLWKEETEEESGAPGVGGGEEDEDEGYDGNGGGLWHNGNGKKHHHSNGGSYGDAAAPNAIRDVVYEYESRRSKRSRTDTAAPDMSPSSSSAVDDAAGSGEDDEKEADDDDEDEDSWLCIKTWLRLRHLSIWAPVGVQLSPLIDDPDMLEDCPNLTEISIQVQGDCRALPGRPPPAFGLGSLCRYPLLKKMELHLGEVEGYALTAPMGHMDLSLWERFYLQGIALVSTLVELEYWPPQDRDVNQRGLSLPSVGLLAECTELRRLVIHGTTHEHFMRFLLKIQGLRDAQLREDYYPAPEDDNSTEMRVDSWRRFEEALNSKVVCD